MKKLFISCPMKGRTKENIEKSMEKIHRIAEIVWNQELEVIQTWIDKEPPEETVSNGVWYLGKSIEMLADADYFIGIDTYNGIFKGCDVEGHVAYSYGIPSFRISESMAYEMMPDLRDVGR